MKKNIRILLFSTFKTSFIEDDFNYLNKNYKTKWIIGFGLKGILKLLMNSYKNQIYIVWFASTYSAIIVFLSKIFNKKSIIIVGGADVVFDKKIGYGLLQSRWKVPIIKFALKNADHIIASSEFIHQKIHEICKKELKNSLVIYPGLNIDFWKIKNANKHRNVLTVAICNNQKRIIVKGIDIYINVAKKMKNLNFTIIGIQKELLKNLDLPKNLTIVPKLNQKELLKYYNESEVYCQLSRKESFGIACAEAILCGCQPIVNNVGGLPEIVKDSQYIVDIDDITQIINTINHTINNSEKFDVKNIQKKYSSFSRYKKLNSIILH